MIIEPAVYPYVFHQRFLAVEEEAAKPHPRPVLRYFPQERTWQAGALRQFTIHNWAELHDLDLSLKQAGVPRPVHEQCEELASSWMHTHASHHGCHQAKRALAVFRTELWLAEELWNGAAPWRRTDSWQVIIDRELPFDSKGRNHEAYGDEEEVAAADVPLEVDGVARPQVGTTTFVSIRKFENPVELSKSQKVWQRWYYAQAYEPKDKARKTRPAGLSSRPTSSSSKPTQQEPDEWTQAQVGRIEAIRDRQNNKKQLQREQRKDKKETSRVRNKAREGSSRALEGC
jgi:hypothetical protein